MAQMLANGRRLLPELRLDAFALDAITVPVLLIWGERDRMVANAGARHVLDALPAATLVLLDGVGHCPQVEDPERFVATLEEFAMRQTPRRP
ncbi:MAG TPA: alpha/beta hydrolase [Baekduia sp.]